MIAARIGAIRVVAGRSIQIVMLALAVPAAAAAQEPTSAFPKPPSLPDPAPLVVPSVKASSLPNGVQLRIVEQRELPLVQIILSVTGGSRLDGANPGIASFMANMLDEGAGTRDALALQSELAFLGASLSTTSDWDRITVSLKAPVRSLPAALDLMGDVVMRPTFREAEVRRQRSLRLTGLLQRRDQPAALAELAFNQSLFASDHPYHRSPAGDSMSVAAFDSARVRQFYDVVMHPSRATVFVAGDLSEAEARSLLSARFSSWRVAAAPVALPAATTAAPSTGTKVYLVDKPGAAQSVIQIGWPGVDRRTPDYAALYVMNTMLGGSFTSRLNMNLRETKGYSYGASSAFLFRVTPGPFVAATSVRTNVTDSSLVELFKELRAIRDAPPTEEELGKVKAFVELRLPGSLESTSQVAGTMATLATFGLALDDLPLFATRVRAVTPGDVQRVARQYLSPERAVVVVVGDLAKIRAGIDALKLGPSTVLEVNVVAR